MSAPKSWGNRHAIHARLLHEASEFKPFCLHSKYSPTSTISPATPQQHSADDIMNSEFSLVLQLLSGIGIHQSNSLQVSIKSHSRAVVEGWRQHRAFGIDRLPCQADCHCFEKNFLWTYRWTLSDGSFLSNPTPSTFHIWYDVITN